VCLCCIVGYLCEEVEGLCVFGGFVVLFVAVVFDDVGLVWRV